MFLLQLITVFYIKVISLIKAIILSLPFHDHGINNSNDHNVSSDNDVMIDISSTIFNVLNLGSVMSKISVSLRVDQAVTLSTAFKDVAGNTVTEGVSNVVWAADKPDLVTVAPAADGASAVVTPVGALGDVVVTTSATLASGHTVSSEATLTITAGKPVSEVLSAAVADTAVDEAAFAAQQPADAPVAPAAAPAV